MTRNVEKEDDDLEKIEVAPPSWEEVLTEKEAQAPAKKNYFQFPSRKKDTNRTGDNEVPMEDVPIKNVSKTEIDNDKEETASCEESPVVKVVTCWNKFIKTLKTMSALTTIIADLFLWACGLGLLVLGCLMQEQKFELVRIIPHYEKKFRAVAQTFIVCGAIYLFIAVPFGIWGVLRRKRKLLKVHNIWIFFNILGELAILLMIFRYLAKSNLNNFQTDFKKYFSICFIREPIILGQEMCCCTFHEKYFVSRGRQDVCWAYYIGKKVPPPNSAQGDRETYRVDCREMSDLFYRVEKWIRKTNYWIPFFLTIQITSFCFGMIQGIIIKAQEPPSARQIRKKYLPPPKNILHKLWRQGTELVYKRMLYCLFIILFAIAVIFLKIHYNNYTVKVLDTPMDISDVIAAIWRYLW